MIILAHIVQGVNVVYITPPLVAVPLYAAWVIAFSSEWQQMQGSLYSPDFILPRCLEVHRWQPPSVQCLIPLGEPLYPVDIIILSLTIMAPFLADIQVERNLTCSAIFIK